MKWFVYGVAVRTTGFAFAAVAYVCQDMPDMWLGIALGFTGSIIALYVGDEEH
ncbi:MAG: hypothetical protein AAB870_03860 [Patescibacteria group bacterium]